MVVGGAGYIGSHTVQLLHAADIHTLVFDNLSTGHLDSISDKATIIADLSDKKSIDDCFKSHQIDLVMHFASSIAVGESVIAPAKYYRNNVANTINLLDSMNEHDVKNIVFSSTAAVYGYPQTTPIAIHHPKHPVNPYGHSKAMVEQIIEDYHKAYDLNYIFLRYFNAAGADPSGKIGEYHEPETHLIPLVMQAASGRKEKIIIFGDNYDTPDGTCIRDYVHVCDIAQAHLLAANRLLQNQQSGIFNLGSGTGYSVKEVIDTAKRVTKKQIKTSIEKRRQGDPAILIADPTEAKNTLNWQPKYNSLEKIIQHAWRWEQKLAAV